MGQPAPARAATRPITAAARDALLEEAGALAIDIATQRRVTQPGDEAIIRLPAADAERRLRAIRELLAVADVVDDPAIAAVGCRVRIREATGAEWTCTLVGPGDGDADRGWVSVDAPVGVALLGRRPGDDAEIVAPGGRWTVTVVGVEEATMLPACPPASPILSTAARR